MTCEALVLGLALSAAAPQSSYQVVLTDGSAVTRVAPPRVGGVLAILELARLSALRIYQGLSERGTPEGPIRMRRATLDADDPNWRERITESI